MREKALNALRHLPPQYHPLLKAPAFDPHMDSKRFYDASKVSDHHAIIPTDHRPGALTADETSLYDLIVRSLIAAHYPDYAYESARLRVVVNGHEFRADGAVPMDLGWRAVLAPTEKKAATPLPDVREGETRTAQKIAARKKQTKPPEKLNDASLLSLMEHAGQELEDEELRERMKSSGLGTPATRAATIERLIEVGLAERAGKSIVSTEKGRKLIAVAPEQIASAATTGKWEKALNDMAANPDAALRAQKRDRFLLGIRRFAIFLVTRRRRPRQTCASSARSHGRKSAPPAKQRPAARARQNRPPRPQKRRANQARARAQGRGTGRGQGALKPRAPSLRPLRRAQPPVSGSGEIRAAARRSWREGPGRGASARPCGQRGNAPAQEVSKPYCSCGRRPSANPRRRARKGPRERSFAAYANDRATFPAARPFHALSIPSPAPRAA